MLTKTEGFLRKIQEHQKKELHGLTPHFHHENSLKVWCHPNPCWGPYIAEMYAYKSKLMSSTSKTSQVRAYADTALKLQNIDKSENGVKTIIIIIIIIYYHS